MMNWNVNLRHKPAEAVMFPVMLPPSWWGLEKRSRCGSKKEVTSTLPACSHRAWCGFDQRSVLLVRMISTSLPSFTASWKDTALRSPLWKSMAAAAEPALPSPRNIRTSSMLHILNS
jgi:hypothetical protein